MIWGISQKTLFAIGGLRSLGRDKIPERRLTY
jgi:hypothetical protein